MMTSARIGSLVIAAHDAVQVMRKEGLIDERDYTTDVAEAIVQAALIRAVQEERAVLTSQVEQLPGNQMPADARRDFIFRPYVLELVRDFPPPPPEPDPRQDPGRDQKGRSCARLPPREPDIITHFPFWKWITGRSRP